MGQIGQMFNTPNSFIMEDYRSIIITINENTGVNQGGMLIGQTPPMQVNRPNGFGGQNTDKWVYDRDTYGVIYNTSHRSGSMDDGDGFGVVDAVYRWVDIYTA